MSSYDDVQREARDKRLQHELLGAMGALKSEVAIIKRLVLGFWATLIAWMFIRAVLAILSVWSGGAK